MPTVNLGLISRRTHAHVAASALQIGWSCDWPFCRFFNILLDGVVDSASALPAVSQDLVPGQLHVPDKMRKFTWSA